MFLFFVLFSTGEVFVSGLNIDDHPQEVRSSMGYCPEYNALWDNLTCKDHLVLYGRLRGVPDNEVMIQKISMVFKIKKCFQLSFKVF